MESIESVLRSDQGVQDMAALYAALNDWYANIRPERKGVRACERVTRIRDDGLVPTAQRYFEHIADTHDRDFNGDAESLLSDWAADFRPDYVARVDDFQWEEYDRSFRRCRLDGENRIGRTALQLGIDVNNVTINVRDAEVLPESLQDEFSDLWQDWFHRLDDLFWNRHDRIYKRLVTEIEDGRVESEDRKWEKHRDRYPDLPSGTIVGGEKVY